MRCICRLFLAIVLCVPFTGFAQDVESATSGFWDDPQTWEGGAVPSAFTAGQIVIRAGHEVVLRDLRVADQLVVNAGGSLLVLQGATLRLNNGSGTDLLVLGRVDVDGTIEGLDGSSISSTAATLFFHEGSLYHHRHTTSEGSLPLAAWHREATVMISGFTTVSSATGTGNWSQDFGSMIWNTPALQSTFDLAGYLDHLQGDFIIQSTGSQILLLSSAAGTDMLQVDGDVQLAGSASMELTSSAAGVFTLIVGEDLFVNTTGVLSLANQGRGVLDLRGDVSIMAGTISESGTGTGDFQFANASRHRFSRGASGLDGVFAGRINYLIAAEDTLDLGISVLSPGTGTNNANTLSLAGTLMVGSTDSPGAIQNNTTGGNIRTTVSQRMFLPGSRVIYAGAQPQFIANSASALTANTETVIDNISGVSLSANITMGGPLHLASGDLQIGNARTLTLSGGVTRSNGQIASNAASTLVISDSTTGNLNLSLSSGQLVLGIFSIDRRAEDATLTLSSDVLVSQLNLISGTLINNNRVSLIEHGMLLRWPRAFLDDGISAIGSGQYDVTYRTASVSTGPFAKIFSGKELPDAPDKLRNLIITTGNGMDTVVLTKDITINNLFDMNRGRFYVQHHTIYFKGTTWSDDAGNFGQGTGLVVFSDSTSVQGSSNAIFNSIRVLPGSYVRFARNITVWGDIDFRPGSVVEASSITMTLTGPTSQHVSTNGVTIGNITVSKSNQSFVQLQSSLPLRGVLRFNTPSANIDFRSDGFLTLLSVTDTATATFGNSMIYRLQNGNRVTGDVTVQRYMSGEGRIYRYLSSPVSNATIASWKDDFSITGNFSDPSPGETICGTATIRSSPSLYYYDETLGSTTSSGYVAYPLPGTSSTSSPIEAGRGYAAFIRECGEPTIVDVTGPVNQLQVDLPVSFTPGSPMSGWNLVGNPYPCTIDWDLGGAQGWIKSNIASSIAIRDNGDGGFYRYWDGDGDPSDIVEGRIAPAQGFWVRATGPDPVLAVREGVKVLQTTGYYRERDTTSVLIVSLHRGKQVDKTYIKIRKGASSALDSLDCPKLNNEAYDLSTYSSDNVTLAINALAEFSCQGEIKLVMQDLEAGRYTFSGQARGIFKNYQFSLYDNVSGKESDLSETLSFDLTRSQVFDDNRFALRWRPRSVQPVQLLADSYTVCEFDSIEVRLADPEKGVRYELWSDSVRVSETLKVRWNDVDIGVNRLQVHVFNGCGGEAVSDTITVIRPNPLMKSWHDGAVCNEGSVLLIAEAEGDAEVRWYSSLNDDLPIGTGGILETPVVTESTSFYVSAVAAGCESRRHLVQAKAILFTPVSLSREGRLLISSMADGNEWFFNGIQLPDEKGDRLYIHGNGVYTVRNSVESCITEATLELSGIASILATVYPNPVESTLTIEADFGYLASIELMNSLGQRIAEIDLSTAREEKIGIFDATKLKAGLYFLRLVTVGRKEEILMVVKK